MDRLEAMSILIAAVETGSLSAAGRKLGTPLPTISRKVAELEAYLHTRLLVRSTRRLILTDSGAAYVAACKRILEQVGEAERTASGEYNAPKGDLIIAAPVVFGRLHVLPAINDFLSHFPDINVRLVLSDRNVNLIDDHVDMAVRIGPLPDSSMVATRVGSVRRVVCGSPAYFAGHGVPTAPADLSAVSCVTFDILASATSWSFAASGSNAEQTVAIRSRLSVNTAEAAIDAAVAGVGVTRVLSYQAAKAIEQGKLVAVLEEFEPEPMPVSLLHAGQGLLPLKMRSFLDFVAPRLRKALLPPKHDGWPIRH
ncbi:LysR family transcriptional regulator [Mesorhizobium sp. Mes31]|uniref:LysR family transcriptional regulator n=1 Tax=Mesorhizobium sp. Mes31 TaxID=2926017 RepID=UPI002117ABB7|nr:LysR family transcriptional regulator [Mesorhizobium sp. Mes31]